MWCRNGTGLPLRLKDIGPRSYGDSERGFVPYWRQEVSPLVAVVDDEYSVRRALVRLVKSAGLSVQGFASAEEFLESHSIRPYDCLILDIRLPGMSGLELQRRLTATRHVLPIIFVTACDKVQARSQSLEGGAHAFFGKPVDEEALLRATRSALQSYDSVVCGLLRRCREVGVKFLTV